MDSQRNEIKFNFYGVGIIVECPEAELHLRLNRDFSYFKVSRGEKTKKVIRIISSSERQIGPLFKLEGKRFKNRNVEVYEKKGIRLCDYGEYGSTLIDFKKQCAWVYAQDMNRLHEVTYLLILSRVGKELDLLGLHRLHGMAVVRNKILYFGMMSTNGGKTTLLSFLLNEGGFSLYSDDSPLIDRQGKVYPFPIRIGFEQAGVRPALFDAVIPYKLKRKEYGMKDLYCLDDLNIQIGGEYNRVVIFKGLKGHQWPSIRKKLQISIFPFIFAQGIIGVGLPILIEYFWEFGFIDFWKKTKIFLSRFVGLTRFMRNAEVYTFEMSSDIEANVNYLKNEKGIN